MSILIISLIVALIVCGAMWKRPDARAAVSGAWQAGKAAAVREFSEGYRFAQQRLRAGEPSWKNPRRWASWGLSVAYGGAKTAAAANRIRRETWHGGRTRYAEWKTAQPVDAEVIEEVSVTPAAQRSRSQTAQPAAPSAEDPRPPPDAAPQPSGHQPGLSPEQRSQPRQQEEEADMQTEATGLTSYANAHTELAAELRERIAGSENLAASMSSVLAEHSDLIGPTAVLQDLLAQAAAVADQVAERSITVANN